MMAEEKPLFVQDGQLCLAFRQALPGWPFDEHSTVTFEFRGGCRVVYHDPDKRDTFTDGGLEALRMAVRTHDDREVELDGCVIGGIYAEM
jgi:hypothetical protein